MSIKVLTKNMHVPNLAQIDVYVSVGGYSGLRKALTRRPVPDGAAERAADAIEAELRAAGVTEVPSSSIGALAMEQLRGIDQIAYIRFASVYQSFEDLEALKREVDTLYAERGDTVTIDLRPTGVKASRR